jgi:apolipoprotein N-acyltransferase
MKIIILFSAGILILAIILIAWRFYNSADTQYVNPKKEVIIKLKAVNENGKKRLRLSDSNGNSATDHLITEVSQGATITWVVKNAGNIEKIDTINSKKSTVVIFQNGVVRKNKKQFELKVPDSLNPGTLEGYLIEFTHIDGETVTIDPYIRIED